MTDLTLHGNFNDWQKEPDTVEFESGGRYSLFHYGTDASSTYTAYGDYLLDIHLVTIRHERFVVDAGWTILRVAVRGRVMAWPP